MNRLHRSIIFNVPVLTFVICAQILVPGLLGTGIALALIVLNVLGYVEGRTA